MTTSTDSAVSPSTDFKLWTDEEAKELCDQLRCKHRFQWADLCFEIARGRNMTQTGNVMEFERRQVAEMLRDFAMWDACGWMGAATAAPPHEGFSRAVMREVYKRCAPEGDPQKKYVDRYRKQGYDNKDVLACLAKAYQAGVKACDQNLLPTATATISRKAKTLLYQAVLERRCSQLESFSKWLDEADLADLRKAMTRKKVAVAHARWMIQVERVENLHPTFDDEVQTYMEENLS